MKNDSVKLVKTVESSGYDIVEELPFTTAAASISATEAIDEALSPIIEGLHRRPEGFEKISGTQIYRAKTLAIKRKNKILPSLRVYFSISGTTVHLRDIEINSDEE